MPESLYDSLVKQVENYNPADPIPKPVNRPRGMADVGQIKRPDVTPPPPPPPSQGNTISLADYHNSRPTPEPAGRTIGGTLKDIGITAGQSLLDTGEAAMGLARIASHDELAPILDPASKVVKGWQESLDQAYSPAQQAANQALNEAEGFTGSLKAMAQNPSTVPHGVLRTVGPMGLGGLMARGGMKATAKIAGKTIEELPTAAKLAALGGGEGAVSMGMGAQEIKAETGELTTGDIGHLAVSGTLTGLITAASGGLAKKLGFVDPEALFAGIAQKTGKTVTPVTFLKAMGQAGISEGLLEEMPQSAQEQMLLNHAMGKPIMEGVTEGMAQGGVIGAAMGMSVNAAQMSKGMILNDRFGDKKTDNDQLDAELSQDELGKKVVESLDDEYMGLVDEDLQGPDDVKYAAELGVLATETKPASDEDRLARASSILEFYNHPDTSPEAKQHLINSGAFDALGIDIPMDELSPETDDSQVTAGQQAPEPITQPYETTVETPALEEIEAERQWYKDRQKAEDDTKDSWHRRQGRSEEEIDAIKAKREADREGYYEGFEVPPGTDQMFRERFTGQENTPESDTRSANEIFEEALQQESDRIFGVNDKFNYDGFNEVQAQEFEKKVQWDKVKAKMAEAEQVNQETIEAKDVPGEVKHQAAVEASRIIAEDPVYEQIAEAKKRGKINMDAFKQDYDNVTARQIQMRYPGLLSHVGTLKPDEFANELGYEGSDQMIEAWKNAKTKKQLQAELTSQFHDQWKDTEAEAIAALEKETEGFDPNAPDPWDQEVVNQQARQFYGQEPAMVEPPKIDTKIDTKTDTKAGTVKPAEAQAPTQKAGEKTDTKTDTKKAPHEMSLDDYWKEQNKPPKNPKLALPPLPKEAAKLSHKREVRHAMDQGKDISPENLKTYGLEDRYNNEPWDDQGNLNLEGLDNLTKQSRRNNVKSRSLDALKVRIRKGYREIGKDRLDVKASLKDLKQIRKEAEKMGPQAIQVGAHQDDEYKQAFVDFYQDLKRLITRVEKIQADIKSKPVSPKDAFRKKLDDTLYKMTGKIADAPATSSTHFGQMFKKLPIDEARALLDEADTHGEFHPDNSEMWRKQIEERAQKEKAKTDIDGRNETPQEDRAEAYQRVVKFLKPYDEKFTKAKQELDDHITKIREKLKKEYPDADWDGHDKITMPMSFDTLVTKELGNLTAYFLDTEERIKKLANPPTKHKHFSIEHLEASLKKRALETEERWKITQERLDAGVIDSVTKNINTLKEPLGNRGHGQTFQHPHNDKTLTNAKKGKITFSSSENEPKAMKVFGDTEFDVLMGLQRTRTGVPDHWYAILLQNSKGVNLEELSYSDIGTSPEHALEALSSRMLDQADNEVALNRTDYTMAELDKLQNWRIRSIAMTQNIDGARGKRIDTLKKIIVTGQTQTGMFDQDKPLAPGHRAAEHYQTPDPIKSLNLTDQQKKEYAKGVEWGKKKLRDPEFDGYKRYVGFTKKNNPQALFQIAQKKLDDLKTAGATMPGWQIKKQFGFWNGVKQIAESAYSSQMSDADAAAKPTEKQAYALKKDGEFVHVQKAPTGNWTWYTTDDLTKKQGSKAGRWGTSGGKDGKGQYYFDTEAEAQTALDEYAKEKGLQVAQPQEKKPKTDSFKDKQPKNEEGKIIVGTDWPEGGKQGWAGPVGGFKTERGVKGAITRFHKEHVLAPGMSIGYEQRDGGYFISLSKGSTLEAAPKESIVSGQEIETDPSDPQKEAGNYQKGHKNFDGMEITIENPVGSTRSGTDPQGKAWSIEMKNDYGYIKGSKGFDKDHIDIFIAPDYKGKATHAYIINQVNKDGSFDEHKTVIGVANEAEALALYNQNYEAGWDGGKSVTKVAISVFKNWTQGNGPAKGEYKRAKTKLAKDLKPIGENNNYVAFRSGAGKPEDFAGQLEAKKPSGIEIQGLNNKKIRDQVVEAAEKGIPTFIDNGAFGMFMRRQKMGPGEASNIIGKYETLVEEAGENSDKFTIVAPDVIGDQQGTLQLITISTLKGRLSKLAGQTDMIFPYQAGEKSPTEIIGEYQKAMGTKDIRIGIPSNEEALPLETVKEILESGLVSKIHFLGLSPANRSKAGKAKLALIEEYPNVDFSMDASRITAKVGTGRPITEQTRKPTRANKAEIIKEVDYDGLQEYVQENWEWILGAAISSGDKDLSEMMSYAEDVGHAYGVATDMIAERIYDNTLGYFFNSDMTKELKQFSRKNAVRDTVDNFKGETTYEVQEKYEGKAPRLVKGTAEDLQTGEQEQGLLFTAPKLEKKSRRKATRRLYAKVKHAASGVFRSDVKTVTTLEDVAHIASPIMDEAQENNIVIMTDANDVPVAVLKHSVGTTNSATIEPTMILGVAHSIPSVAKVWVAHNHPSGNAQLSPQDRGIASRLATLSKNTGVEVQGLIAVMPDGTYSGYERGPGDKTFTRLGLSFPRPVGKEIKIKGIIRKVTKLSDQKIIKRSEDVNDWLDENARGESGIMLLSTSNQVVGFVPMEVMQMAKFRTGEKGTGASKILAAIEETNATGAIVVTANNAPPGAFVNPIEFMEAHNMRMLDTARSGKADDTDIITAINPTGVFYSTAFTNQEQKNNIKTSESELKEGNHEYIETVSQTNLESPKGKNAGPDAKTESTEQIAILRSDRLQDHQTISTIADAQDWLARHKFPRIAKKGQTKKLIESLLKNKAFNKLPIFDRIRIAAQVERPIRNSDYNDKSKPSQNRKLGGNSIRVGQNQKVAGSNILGIDTVRGCDHFCYECYALKGAAQGSISHQHPVNMNLNGTIKTDEYLRVGETGDPSKNWAWSHEQISALLERSRKRGQEVDADNVFYITKLLSLKGYNPETARNLQVTLDPLYPDHAWRSMSNIMRLKAAHPDVNISVRIRTFSSSNADLNDAMMAAVDFANDLGLPVLETKMRFMRKTSFDLLELNKKDYAYDGNQYKIKESQIQDETAEHHMCGGKNDSACPGCKNCIKLTIERGRITEKQNKKVGSYGISGMPLPMTETFDPIGVTRTGKIPKFSQKQPSVAAVNVKGKSLDDLGAYVDTKQIPLTQRAGEIIDGNPLVTPWYLPTSLVRRDRQGNVSHKGQPRNNFEVAERIADRLFGKKIVWATIGETLKYNGVAIDDPQFADTILLDVRTPNPVHSILGHELSHYMKFERPDIYSDLYGAVKPMLQKQTEYMVKYGHQGKSRTDINEEILADVMGDAFTDPDFWNKVAQESPSRIKRILATVQEWIDKLLGRVKDFESFGVDQFVTDLEAARKAVVTATARYAAEPGVSTGQGQTQASDTAAPWYSRLSNILSEKGPEAATVDQWKKTIEQWKKKGTLPAPVQEELEWSGLDGLFEYFEMHEPKTKIRKDKIISWIDENGVKIEEIEKGELTKENIVYPDSMLNTIDRQLSDSGLFQTEDIEDWIENHKGHRRYDLENALNEIGEMRNLQEIYEDDFMDMDNVQGTRFEKYTLPGGENYRELLLKLPDPSWMYDGRKDAPSMAARNRNYDDGHWEEPNVLAHVRFNERTDTDGSKVLFLEEVQSDWHQEGRRIGYQGEKPKITDLNTIIESSELKELEDKVNNSAKEDQDAFYKDFEKEQIRVTDLLNHQLDSFDLGTAFKFVPDTGGWSILERAVAGEGGITAAWGETPQEAYDDLSPGENLLTMQGLQGRTLEIPPNAPFKKSWPMLAMKRMIRYAAENGYDKVAWTTGEQQTDRYDLRKQVSKIGYMPNGDGTFNVQVKGVTNEETLWHDKKATPKIIEKTIGKDMLKKVQDSEGYKTKSPLQEGKDMWILEGNDLEIGGEGMQSFYNKMLPSQTGKFIKKFGAKVAPIEIGDDSYTIITRDKYDEITGANSKKFVKNLPFVVVDSQNRIIDGGQYETRALAEQALAKIDKTRVNTQLGFQVTEKMRSSALKEGMPKFSRVAPPNFSKWFGTSKVTDSTGKPKVVYHGSATFGQDDNYTFQDIDQPNTASPLAGLGFFFAESEPEGRGYAGAGGEVQSVFLNIENPLKIGSWDLPTFNDRAEAKAFQKRKELQGYDGIFLTDERHWIAFKPNQVKSSDKNVGTYSADNPDIRYSKAAQEQQEMRNTADVNPESAANREYGEQIINDMIRKLRDISSPAVAKARYSDRHLAAAMEKYREAVKIINDPLKSVAEKQKFAAGFVQKLPKEPRAKLLTSLSKISRVKREETQHKRLNRFLQFSDKVMTDHFRKMIMVEIGKATKPFKKIKGKMEKGRGAQFERDLAYIRGTALKLDSDEAVAGEIGKLLGEKQAILDKIEDAEPADIKIMQERLDDIESHQIFADLYGNMREQSFDELMTGLKEMNYFLFEGRARWKAIQERLRTKNDFNRLMVNQDITGQDEPDPEAPGVKSAREADEKTLKGRAKEAMSLTANLINSWELMMDKIAKNAGEGTLKSKTVKHFGSLVHRATRAYEEMQMNTHEMIMNKAQEIFGAKNSSELSKTFAELNKTTQGEIVLYETKETEVDGEIIEEVIESPLTMTPLQAAYWYQISKANTNPVMIKTFEKMGITEQTMKQIDKVMGPELKQWADYLVDEFYQDFHTDTNDVYRLMYGIDLEKTADYVPWHREVGGKKADMEMEGFLNGTMMGSIKKGSLIPRVKNTKRFKMKNINDVLVGHISDMNHFKAWALPTKEINATFNDPQVRNFIRQHHGADTMRTISRFQDKFVRTEGEMQDDLKFLDRMRGNVTRALIGANPVVFLKQLASIPAYMAGVPMTEWTKYTGQALTNPKMVYDVLSESTMWKARYKKGFERDIATAMRRGGSDIVAQHKRWGDKVMVLTALGDGTAILMGGWASYQHHKNLALKEGKSKAEAHKHGMEQFEMATERSQQSGNLKDLGWFQSGTPMMKLFTMFMTAPASYSRQIFTAVRNAKTDPKDSAKRLFIFGVMMPVIFQGIADALMAVDGDDEDKERFLRNQGKALALGPMNGLPVIRTIMEGHANAVAGHNFYRSQYSPVMELFETSRETVSDFTKFMEGGTEYVDGEEYLIQSLIGLTHTFGFATGIPTKPVGRLVKGAKDIYNDDTDYPIRRGIGYSPYVVGE